MKCIHIIYWIPTDNKRDYIPGTYNFYGDVSQKSEVIKRLEYDGFEYEIEEYDDNEIDD